MSSRPWTGFTIDAATTVDRDDAIHVCHYNDGSSHVFVYVTDLTQLVKKGSQASGRAHERLETLYRHKTFFMLPKWLQEKGSLDEGQDRPVVRVAFGVNPDGSVGTPDIDLGTFRSEKQLAYSQIPGILADAGHPFHERITWLANFAQKVLERRRNAGALAFYDLNFGWVSTEEGLIHKLKDISETMGYIIIQELMIMANCALAEFAAENDIPLLYRNHTARDHAPSHGEILKQLNNALLDPTSLDTVRKRVHLFMNRATYGPELKGHFGLNVPAYLHGTSPLRRYADMVSQRQLVASLQGGPLPYSREEMDELGEHITTTLEARKEATSTWHRERANKKAEGRTSKVNTLINIEPKDFERVLKMLAENGGEPDGVAEAYPVRMRKGMLRPIDMLVVLFKMRKQSEAWQALRQATFDHLVENPHLGITLLTMGEQHKLFEKIKFKTETKGEDHKKSFYAAVRMEGMEPSFVRAGSIKLAKQRAAVNWIGWKIGVGPGQWDDKKQKQAKKQKVVTDLPSDPVAALNQMCQQLDLGPPTFEFERSGGEDHLPLWSCRASAGGHNIATKPQGNKKACKKQAARALIVLLNG